MTRALLHLAADALSRLDAVAAALPPTGPEAATARRLLRESRESLARALVAVGALPGRHDTEAP